MKRTVRLLCLMAALLLCLPLLAACDDGGNTDTTTEQEATEQTTQAESPTEDEIESELETTPDTEDTTVADTTEAETQPPEPEIMTTLSFSTLSPDLDLSKYLFQSYQCTATLVNHPEDGQLLALTTSSVSTPASSDPYIYFRHAQLAKALGFEAADTREYPYVVLRIKGEGLTGGIFSFFGYKSKTPSGTGVTGQVDYRLQSTDEWQYLWIDLSKYDANLSLWRLDMENMAGANGEVLYISDVMFFADKEQSMTYQPSKTYPVTEQTAENYTAKVMSFNVQTENGTQVRADIRADMLRDLIDEYQPDSIGMQEVTTLWRGMMDNFVFNKSYAGVGEPRTQGGEACPIYYRTDKFDLVDSGTFWLSDTPEVAGSQFEESLYVRICTWVHLRDKVTGKEYVHVNTHLDNLGSSDGRSLRTKQIIVILKFIQRFGDIPMVLTGDLNQAAVNSEGNQYAVYKTLTGAKAFELDDGTKAYSPFSNARYDAPDNMPEGTCATMTTYYDENGTKYNPAKEPIDYVLYTGASLTALSYKIRLYDRCGLYLSDHLPVVCEIKFAPAPTEE